MNETDRYPPPRREEAADHFPKCISCGYPLVKLESDRCPECGTPFDLDDHRTFRYFDPINWFRYWLPPFLVLGVAWFAAAFLLLQNNSVGWALVLGTPITIGFLAGYGLTLGVRRIVMLGGMLIVGVGTCLVMANAVGPFCGLILSILFVLPYLLGAAFGIVLRLVLKDSEWYSQARHLPVIAALLVPPLTEVVERSLKLPKPIVSQSTAILMHASLKEAWQTHARDSDAVAKGSLHAVRLTRPLEQIGGREVGEVSTIRFSKGELRVRVTHREPLKRFGFDYIGQSHVEDHAIRLLDSSFDFASVTATETKLTITTRYEALMTPRWYWRPFERWSGEVTHELIGRQMQRDVETHRAERVPSGELIKPIQSTPPRVDNGT